MCETPPRSPTIVGIAVDTMVWSRLDTSMPAISAEKIRLIRRRVSTMGAAGPDGVTVVGGADTRLLGDSGRGGRGRGRGSGERLGDGAPGLLEVVRQGPAVVGLEPGAAGGAGQRLRHAGQRGAPGAARRGALTRGDQGGDLLLLGDLPGQQDGEQPRLALSQLQAHQQPVASLLLEQRGRVQQPQDVSEQVAAGAAGEELLARVRRTDRQGLADHGALLGREVVEERPHRDAHLAADLLDGDGVQAVLQGEPTGGRAQLATGRGLLRLPQGRPRFVLLHALQYWTVCKNLRTAPGARLPWTGSSPGPRQRGTQPSALRRAATRIAQIRWERAASGAKVSDAW